jgi:Protein of unknown function (DUF3105)
VSASGRLGRIGLLGCALLAGAACSETVPATQVIVTVNSDLEVGEELASVVVYVVDPDSNKVVGQHPFELTKGAPRNRQVRLPFSFGLTKAQKSRFRLDVIGYAPTGSGGAEEAVVEQKVLGTFRDRETLLLKVFLAKACFMRMCEEDDRTCYPERDGDVEAGDCGDVLEPTLATALAGDERDAWTKIPSGSAGNDGGVAGSDEGGASGSGTAGRAGGAGRDGGAGDAAAGTGGGAGEGEAGETGEAGEGAGTGGSGQSGGSGGAGAGSGGAGEGAGGSAGTPACVPTGETMHVTEDADHVPVPPAAQVTSPSDYGSDPPSSGLHCEAFGMYTTFTEAKPLPLCNWVHNLEHGAVVLLYNCPTPCPEIVDGLEQVIAGPLPDPDCTGAGLKRLILTPYDGMSARFAATTWGYTWTSNCDTITAADRAALHDFIEEHWGTRGIAPEKDLCYQGSVTP